MTPSSLRDSPTNASGISVKGSAQRVRKNRKNRSIAKSLAWIFRTNLPQRRSGPLQSREKRDWFGFGEVLEVVANPSDTLEQLNQTRKELEKAQYELRLHAAPFASCLPPQSFSLSSLPHSNENILLRPSESSAFHQILAGPPVFTVLSGPPSVGKTTLLREVLKEEKYYVLYFDMKVVGGAGLEGLFSGLCAALEWFMQSMLKDIKEGVKDDEELEKAVKAVKHGSRILADRLDKPYPKEINSVGGITTTDVARLIQLFRTALLLSWQLPGRPQFRSGIQARANTQPTHHKVHSSETAGEGTSSEETKVSQGQAQAEKQGHVQFEDPIERGDEHRETGENAAGPSGTANDRNTANIDEKDEREWEEVNPTKRIPVLVFDDAHKLPSLVHSSSSFQIVQYLLEGLVVLSKQDHLCHVVHTTNDGLYVNWLREMGVLDGCKIVTLTDPPKPQIRTYLTSHLVPTFPAALRGRLESEEVFEKLYGVFGGRLAHWTEFIADWVNAGGDLPVERSNPFLQAYTQLNFLLLRASETECEDQLELEEEETERGHGHDRDRDQERRSRMRMRPGDRERCHSRCRYRSRSRSHVRAGFSGRRGMKSSTTLIGLSTAEAGDMGLDRREDKEERVPFTTMELLDIFYRLTSSSSHPLASVVSPTIRPVSMKSIRVMEQPDAKDARGVSYFALCKELGSMRAVDFLVKSRIVEMRSGRTLPSTPSSALSQQDSSAMAGPSTSTYNLNMHLPYLSREDIVPMDERSREENEVAEVGGAGGYGPTLLPLSPILAYAMRVVLDEYEYQPPQEEVEDIVDGDMGIGGRIDGRESGGRGGRGGREDDGLFYGEEGYDTRGGHESSGLSDGQSDYVSLEDVSEY